MNVQELKAPRLNDTSEQSGKASGKEIVSWVLYHFANAGFPAVVAAAIFNAYFVDTVCGGAHLSKGLSTLIWTLAVGLSNFLVVASGPLLGAACDFSAAKKKALVFATIFCVVTTALLYFVGPGSYILGFALVTLSYFAFSTGENLLASFLPEISNPGNIGRVSATGAMVSHLGGLTILGICFAYVNYAQKLGQAAYQYVPNTALLVAANYALFALPLVFCLKEHVRTQPAPEDKSYWQIGFERIQDTFNHARKFNDLIAVLATILLYTCGTSTVVVLAGVYAHEVMSFTMSDTITMFIIVNLTATAGAYFFGHIQDRLGSKTTLTLTLSLWLFANLLLAFSTNRLLFWIATNVIGLANGASFTVGRAMVGQFSPKGRAGEFFGLWGLAAKTAAIIGPISYGLIAYLTNGNHRLAILSTGAFFALALFVLQSVNEKRGRQAAQG